ncbi:MAG: prolyl oligopeptidase family serine peptidase [Gammaproteobacteria bacterium]
MHTRGIVAAALFAAAFCATASGRGWTTRDIIELREITGTALAEGRADAAFIVKQRLIEPNDTRYTLYTTRSDLAGPARKLLESSYLADLSWHAAARRWTVRADLGEGVQLYDVDASGHATPLVIVHETAPIGGTDGVIADSSDGAHETGVVSYEWAPDGRALWYSRPRLLTAKALQALRDDGVFYDRLRMIAVSMAQQPSVLEGLELHRLDVASKADIPIAFARSSVQWDQGTFTRSQTRWSADGKRILFLLRETGGQGETKTAVSGADARGGKVTALDGDVSALEYLRGRNSAATFAPRATTAAVGPDHIAECSFNGALTVRVCVRQSLTVPPELVAVSPQDGRIVTLVRPNAQYDEIEPLHSERREWTNRFGVVNDGYVTYPRDYVPGQRYPTLVVTHGGDAQNKFAYSGFQWDYPIQVFAERGYFVLSVNDPRTTPRTRAAQNAYSTTSASASVDEMQFATGYNAVASMEAALQALVEEGKADPERTGIAGYSRGSIVTRFVLSQSKRFKVGSGGDSNLFDAGNYWAGGSAISGLYQAMFGGSPADPAAVASYQRFSPSFRAAEFAGPLLQQRTQQNALFGLELYFALHEAGVPTELVFYPRETHLFHEPRHREAAMQLNLQWFDYWLLGRRSPEEALRGRYASWDAMAKEWAERKR